MDGALSTDTQKDVFDKRGACSTSFEFGGVCSFVVVTMRGGKSAAADLDVDLGVSFGRLLVVRKILFSNSLLLTCDLLTLVEESIIVEVDEILLVFGSFSVSFLGEVWDKLDSWRLARASFVGSELVRWLARIPEPTKYLPEGHVELCDWRI
ncbi:hypothetical protein Tco_1171687 [Tanacetum coccineum]